MRRFDWNAATTGERVGYIFGASAAWVLLLALGAMLIAAAHRMLG